jgi:hypothetical protein
MPHTGHIFFGFGLHSHCDLGFSHTLHGQPHCGFGFSHVGQGHPHLRLGFIQTLHVAFAKPSSVCNLAFFAK